MATVLSTLTTLQSYHVPLQLALVHSAVQIPVIVKLLCPNGTSISGVTTWPTERDPASSRGASVV